jgi:hypothetical protein
MTGAYSFVCAYSSTDTLCARLNQIAWQWSVGDSHWYGDYVATAPSPGVRIRIVDFPKLPAMDGPTSPTSALAKTAKLPWQKLTLPIATCWPSYRPRRSGKSSGLISGMQAMVFESDTSQLDPWPMRTPDVSFRVNPRSHLVKLQ